METLDTHPVHKDEEESSVTQGFDDFDIIEGTEFKTELDLVKGENGAFTYETSNSKLVDLFFKSVRGISFDTCKELVNEILEDPDLSKESAIQFAILMFNLRDCRGGKGERDIFNNYFKCFAYRFPDPAADLIPKIMEFGYGKDLINLIGSLHFISFISNDKEMEFSNKIICFCAEQIADDYEKVQKYNESVENGEENIEKPSISLLAKWMPREGCHFAKHNPRAFQALTGSICVKIPLALSKMKKYRKIITTISKFLDVSEIKMAGNRYSEIEYEKICSKNLNKFRKAHLNELIEKNPYRQTPIDPEKGNRYPERDDRVKGRQNLLNVKKVSGKQLYPHEIATKLLNANSSEENILLKQWSDFKTTCKSNIRIVPLSDVSGSMNGIPMEVSRALGVLISELNTGFLSDTVFTFSSTPEMLKFNSEQSTTEKIKILNKSEWGGSTDLISVFGQIIDEAKRQEVRNEDIPSLAIFSDMQFDEILEHGGRMETHLKIIDKKFEDAGYTRPTIIFWNLRNSTGIPAKDDEKNVILLSGFSPSLLQYLINGKDIEEEINPNNIVRKIINDTRYGEIRTILENSSDPFFRKE